MAIEITSIPEQRRLPRLRRARSLKIRAQAERADTRRRLLRFAAIALAAAACVSLVTVFYLYRSHARVIDERLASGYLTSRAGLYAAPRTLRKGQGITSARLVEMLKRAGYVEGDAGAGMPSAVWSGSFRAGDGHVEILPRRAHEAGGRASFGAVRVEFNNRGRIAAVRGDGAEIDSYTLEPEPLAQDVSMKTAERPALSYEDLPPTLVQAILAIEDRRFFEHNGVDAQGLARALLSWGDVKEDQKQGGSTITQQLVKNTYLTPERTLRRKMNEAILATALERRLSKQDILALYCNEIYLGQRGSMAVRGVDQAARVYFGKELKELTLAEAATIAGMIQSPGRYAPDRHAERARLRRNTVIDAMLRDGVITPEQAASASDEAVSVVPAEEANAAAPYFIDYVNRAVEARSGGDEEEENHLRVYTTIDLELQRLAEESVARQLERLEKVFKGKRRPQAALVALDPQTGNVLAMVGGGSYAESQLNRVTDARRQPGSVFKPIVYAAALESGISPVTLSADAPREFSYDYRSKYKPANYGGGYSMRDVTLRTGLVRSLNVVTVDVAMRTGLSRVASYAERLGLPRPDAYPSLALGTTEATPLEVASAYAVFANGGSAVRASAVSRYEDVIDPAAATSRVTSREQVIKPATSYMITDMLTAVVDHGTARAARGVLNGVAIAGKTGTSRDGWFAGYTPNLVCVVWVGFDDNEQLGLTGADSALPAWVDFMRGATELRPELGGEHFARPASITTVEIDAETGLLASDSCPHRERIAVSPALAPQSACLTHMEGYGELAVAGAADYYDSSMIEAEVNNLEDAAADDSARPRLPEPMSVSDDSMPAPRPKPVTAVRVERGRNGRPVLTNEVRVYETEGAGSKGWNH
ncbi:MAG TPA: PBP1A family penicillin-binding protein [Pyrinomonadaceae bacterium]